MYFYPLFIAPIGSISPKAILARATYKQDCCLLTPLTPTTDYQQFSKEFTHTNGRTNTHTNTHTKYKMFHAKAENFAASRKNFTASQKNLTASRKCFTGGHDTLVSPLVRL